MLVLRPGRSGAEPMTGPGLPSALLWIASQPGASITAEGMVSVVPSSVALKSIEGAAGMAKVTT